MSLSTVIFTAVAPEAAPILRRLRLSARTPSQFADSTTLLQITGMGRAAALQAVQTILAQHTPARVLISGLCGALDPALKIADVLHFTQIKTLLPDPQTFTSTQSGLASTPSNMTLLTADHLITTPTEKSQLHQQTRAHAVDMESAAIAAVCDSRRIPWFCIRAVSDTADQSLPAYLAQMVDPLGRPRPLATLGQLLPHPSRIGALLKIARQSRAASHALADAVADACRSETPES